MKKLFLFAAALGFLFGCADVPSDLLEDAQGNKFTYCVYDYERVCLAGPFTNKSCNGALSNECPYDIVGTACGDYWYDAADSNLRCYNGTTLQAKCGDNWYGYDEIDKKCQSDILTKCGNDWYNAANTNLKCENNVVETRCGTSSIYYNAANAKLRCSDNTVEIKCGNVWFVESTSKRCDEASNVIETRCGYGDEWFDATNTNLRCSGSRVQAGCGENWYNIANQRCGAGDVIETQCGTIWGVETYNFGCYDDVWMTRCGAFWYNATNTNLRCQDYVIETRCGTGNYFYDITNTDLKCEGNIVQAKCGATWYDNSQLQYCSNGALKTYKTTLIGEQTWLAENLNYAASGWCYDDLESNCEIYGRFYNWAAAMALPSHCNDSSCEDQIQQNHRGICPEGWHIPSLSEFHELMEYVQTDNGEIYDPATRTASIAGKYLKATNGWADNGNGEDKYEFAAFPSFYLDDGSWWIANEYGSYSTAFSMMSYSDYVSLAFNASKAFSYSIRCVKDTE